MAQYNNIYMSLYGEIMGETDKAIKFDVEDEDNSIRSEWIPISQTKAIHRLHDTVNGTKDVLLVSEWLLKQKNLIHLASTKPPVLPGTPTTVVPKIQDKLQHPPVSSWSDMDDDIPF